jgi:hypothetical protein
VAKKFSDIPPRNPAAWTKLGNKVIGMIKKWTIEEGRDVFGKKFPKYSTKYRKAKIAGKFKRQTSRSGKPNFVLTGDTMGDLKVLKATKDSVIIGWTSWGHVIERFADVNLGSKRRAVTTKEKPVAKHIADFIVKDYLKQMDINIRQIPPRTVIKIGK